MHPRPAPRANRTFHRGCRTISTTEYEPEEQAFLDAILAEPDDDNLRLVYADWLEERGDVRAAFVRRFVSLRDHDVNDGRRVPILAEVVGLARPLNPEWVHTVSNDELPPPPERMTEEGLLAELAVRWNATAVRRFYADWLDANGQPAKAAYVRAESAYFATRFPSLSECRRLHSELRHARQNVDDDPWVARIAQLRVENCREQTECRHWWLVLDATDDPMVRHCQSCNRDVFYCRNVQEAATHNANRELIALDTSVVKFAVRTAHPSYRGSSHEILDVVLPAPNDS